MFSDQKRIVRAEGPTANHHQTAAEIEEWLVAYLATKLQQQAGEIDRGKSLTFYGLCSAEAVTLVGDLENYLGRSLSPTLVWNYPTIDGIANHLGSDTAPAESAHESDPYEQCLDEILATIETS